MRAGSEAAGGRPWAFVPVLVWTAVVLWLGSRPDLGVPVETDHPIDKLGHFGMYGVLGLALAWGWLRNGRRPRALLLVGLGVLVGVLDELVQLTVPGRSAEVADVLADAAGVVVGFAAGVRVLARRLVRQRGEG